MSSAYYCQMPCSPCDDFDATRRDDLLFRADADVAATGRTRRHAAPDAAVTPMHATGIVVGTFSFLSYIITLLQYCLSRQELPPRMPMFRRDDD